MTSAQGHFDSGSAPVGTEPGNWRKEGVQQYRMRGCATQPAKYSTVDQRATTDKAMWMDHGDAGC
jgi:hypothetical protein